VFYGGAAGGGKAEKLSELIPTPSGWSTFGKISAGNTVFDENGQACSVLRAYEVFTPEKAYRLTFDDGSVVEACSEHTWLTFSTKELAALTRRTPEWRAKRRAKRSSRATGHKSKLFTYHITERNKSNPPESLSSPAGSVRTTQEIFETLRTQSGRTNHAIPLAGALELPRVFLPLDPYCLGAWLGDGSKDSGQIAGIDEGVFAEFAKAGFVFDGADGRCSKRIRGFQTILRTVGVFRDKHIPAVYLRSSKEQRLALLQGLMDTDGTVYESGSVEFTNTNKRIIDGVYELIVSLGWKARVVESRATLYGKDCGPKWDIKWTPSEYVFRLSRKLAKQKLATRRTTEFRYIVDCQPITPEPMRCIEVDSPSHLFLCNRSMIPTHNSSALLMAALEDVQVKNYSALLLRRTYADLSKPGALLDRAASWLRNSSAKWNEQKKQWLFPSGAKITFGYLEAENDKYNYQSSEYQYIAFDELTQFSQSQYLYLFSRLRRLVDSDVPLRMRAGSNPGGTGGRWVQERFIPDGFTPQDAQESRVWEKTGTDEQGRAFRRVFVPARMHDNPHLDQAEYLESLNELDAVTREQLLQGDWLISERGDVLPMWDERVHVITWEQFAEVFGEERIPDTWLLGIYQDWGTTELHPCVTSWFATAPKNAPVINGVAMAGQVFLYRGFYTWDATVREVANGISERMTLGEQSRCRKWQMSHEAASERIAYRREHSLPFEAWETGKTRGIAQLRNALELVQKDKPHPFKPQLAGHPQLYFIIDSRELVNPKTDRGLARWRAEAPAYKWATLKSGEPASLVVPHALFNDAMDSVRAAAADYWPMALPKTKQEQIIEELPQTLKPETIIQSSEDTKGLLMLAQQKKWAEIEKRLNRKPTRSVIGRHRQEIFNK
jgi:hypothetical protein